MNKPVLVVMAAGLGSRYGGLKQIDPVGNHGQLIIDYSIYDALREHFGLIPASGLVEGLRRAAAVR